MLNITGAKMQPMFDSNTGRKGMWFLTINQPKL